MEHRFHSDMDFPLASSSQACSDTSQRRNGSQESNSLRGKPPMDTGSHAGGQKKPRSNSPLVLTYRNDHRSQPVSRQSLESHCPPRSAFLESRYPSMMAPGNPPSSEITRMTTHGCNGTFRGTRQTVITSSGCVRSTTTETPKTKPRDRLHLMEQPDITAEGSPWDKRSPRCISTTDAKVKESKLNGGNR